MIQNSKENKAFLEEAKEIFLYAFKDGLDKNEYLLFEKDITDYVKKSINSNTKKSCRIKFNVLSKI